MKFKVLSFLFFILFSLFLFSQNEIKEGEWEITIKMQMEGMDFEMPAQTIKQCIKKDSPFIEPKQEKGKPPSCKILKQDIKGGTVSYEMECKENGEETMIKGTTIYKGNSFEGNATIKMIGKETYEMKQTMTGKYIGPCK